MNSRLNLALREKHGFTYNIESFYSTYTDTGIFGIYFGTEQEKVEVFNFTVEKVNGRLPIVIGIGGNNTTSVIEAFGKYLTSLGKKVAVLAIDPSSTISHGSILGDKTRMEELVKDENAYIRPSASGETLGGVARKTRETIILCEAAGFDTIIIETVGVGQSETAVHSMVDFFLLLKISGAGDELQGIKRGIMEMADGMIITKADGENIQKSNWARREYANALHLFPPKENDWITHVHTASSLKGEGFEEIWKNIDSFFNRMNYSGWITENRKRQELAILEEKTEKAPFDYERFKELNERTKAAEQKLKEFEEQKKSEYEAQLKEQQKYNKQNLRYHHKNE